MEFALALPLLLLLMMGIIEFGRAFLVYTGMFNAAREATRYGVVHPENRGGIELRAREMVFLVDGSVDAPDPVDVTVRYHDPSTGETYTDTAKLFLGHQVVVTLTHDLPTITPLIRPIVPSLPIETRATRTIAKFDI